MTDTKMTADELVLSLTGYEEFSIEKHMQVDPYADGERKPVRVMRGLAFILYVRGGMNVNDAAKAAMELPFGEVNGLFADEPVKEDGTETIPVTAAGNDSAPSE